MEIIGNDFDLGLSLMLIPDVINYRSVVRKKKNALAFLGTHFEILIAHPLRTRMYRYYLEKQR